LFGCNVTCFISAALTLRPVLDLVPLLVPGGKRRTETHRPLLIDAMIRRGYSMQLLAGPVGTTAVFSKFDLVNELKEVPPPVVGAGPEVLSRAVIVAALRALCPDELAQVQALPAQCSEQWQ
jgi:hypothetical protein